VILAATNRPNVLDPALLRPGRFDRRIVGNRPDVRGREGVLSVHTRKSPLSEDVDTAVLARGTSGFSGADLANLVNEAALHAARDNRTAVRMIDFELAKDKVLLPHADPIHKVTIIPRGMALGLTQQLPVDEKHHYSNEYLDDQIAMLMGGRIAAEIATVGITTGAGNDFDRATKLARCMVCEWGMSDAVGPLTFGKKAARSSLAGRSRSTRTIVKTRLADRPGGQAHR
jgi:cell division protease FtsH